LKPRLGLTQQVPCCCCCRGDNGYIHIARHNHACGVTTDPMYAVFESKHHEALELDVPVIDALPVA
jgi:hypothetical protein